MFEHTLTDGSCQANILLGTNEPDIYGSCMGNMSGSTGTMVRELWSAKFNITYPLVMTNIAMENPLEMEVLIGKSMKIIYKWAIFHGYVK